MDRTSDGTWSAGWAPPPFEAGANGKVVAATSLAAIF